MLFSLFVLFVQLTYGHVLVFGAHKSIGKIAAKRAKCHGFEVTAITPQNRRAFFDEKDKYDKTWNGIIIDGTTVTLQGIVYVMKRFPGIQPDIVFSKKEAFVSADRMFGRFI